MKKIINIFSILAVLSLIIFSTRTYAASLDSIDINTSKTIVRPGEEVEVTINFGEDLGAYTFDIAYDDNLFEYASVDGGTANDTADKVRVTYYDATGGTNPRANMSIKFNAKTGITTSNPTEFTITAEGLANSDASVTYDDITTPIVKNVTVEPEYQDYELKLEYTGEIVKGEEKEMTLSYSSAMGRYYNHARLVAEYTAPTGATVQLLANDENDLEHDIIQSGWGDAQGFAIGGKDVMQILQTRAMFSEQGNYTITLKLIDRDNSDSVIAEKEFKFAVLEEHSPVTPPAQDPDEQEPPVENTPTENPSEETEPTTLPKTGSNIYIPIVAVLVGLVGISAYSITKKK